MHWFKDTPGWVLAICLALASIEPLSHLALSRIDNDTAVFSGLHHHDTAIFLACMEMLDNGFHSPYATCKAPNGANDIAFLPTPFHWLYAVVGAAGRLSGIEPFLFLGIANGLGGLVYLLCVYRFLRVAVPELSNFAFLLFSLGGGLGGIAWWVSLAAGWTEAAGFDRYFYRFLMYELLEGPGLLPVLHMPRLYYTLSLALGFGALTALLDGLRINCSQHTKYAGFLLFCAALVNLRHGAFCWAIAAVYMTCRLDRSFPSRLVACARFAIPLVLAALVYGVMGRMSPVMVDSSLTIVRESLWPTAFVSVAALHLALLGWSLPGYVSRLGAFQRVAALAALGYLSSLAALFVGYAAYYGNFWNAGDFSALVRVSDFALVGGVVGLMGGVATRGRAPMESDELDWVWLWALAFMAIGMSAWGQGWGLRLAPQRLLLFLGLPLSILSAAALATLREQRPAVARGLTATFVFCGLSSIAAGALFIQAPLGSVPGEGPYAHLHPEIVSPAEAALIDQIESGVVLAPKGFADIIAMREGVQVLGGVGAADLSDQPSYELNAVVAHFFSSATDEERRAIVDEWCVDWVFVPEGKAFANDRDDGWLVPIAVQDGGTVFRVRREH